MWTTSGGFTRLNGSTILHNRQCCQINNGGLTAEIQSAETQIRRRVWPWETAWANTINRFAWWTG